MKKLLLFLLTILGLYTISITNVNAKATFYEAEKIDNIWTKSVKKKETHFQKARFYRRVSDNKPAYCVEPFLFFNENSTYDEILNPNNITQETWNKMSLIAHFGYGYENHTDNKWYAITQLMIWKEADKDGDFYFTDKLNGSKINIFEEEQQEIYNLIENYLKTPNIKQEINLVENKSITLTDTNNVLNDYEITTKIDNIKIENNNITISNLKEGNYVVNLKKKNSLHNEASIYYYNAESQNLMTAGDMNTNNIEIKLHVKKTKIEITKHDSKTKSKTPSGDGKLEGAVYGIYKENNELVGKLTIKKDCKANIENIEYGKYIIKEIKAPTGYELDNKTYEVNLNESNNIINLIVENKIIEKKVKIHKEYSNTNMTLPEEGIIFEIYDIKNNLYKTVTTDALGNIEVILPFGEYKIIQKNTTEGYNKVEPFNVSINKDYNEDEIYNLMDYEIKVPNTYSNKKENINILRYIIILLFTYEKKFFTI